MTDERLERLATYFIHFNIRNRYGITFERFTHLVMIGEWKRYVTD